MIKIYKYWDIFLLLVWERRASRQPKSSIHFTQLAIIKSLEIKWSCELGNLEEGKFIKLVQEENGWYVLAAHLLPQGVSLEEESMNLQFVHSN